MPPLSRRRMGRSVRDVAGLPLSAGEQCCSHPARQLDRSVGDQTYVCPMLWRRGPVSRVLRLDKPAILTSRRCGLSCLRLRQPRRTKMTTPGDPLVGRSAQAASRVNEF
jgi:hypothetical protein